MIEKRKSSHYFSFIRLTQKIPLTTFFSFRTETCLLCFLLSFRYQNWKKIPRMSVALSILMKNRFIFISFYFSPPHYFLLLGAVELDFKRKWKVLEQFQCLIVLLTTKRILFIDRISFWKDQ